MTKCVIDYCSIKIRLLTELLTNARKDFRRRQQAYKEMMLCASYARLILFLTDKTMFELTNSLNWFAQRSKAGGSSCHCAELCEGCGQQSKHDAYSQRESEHEPSSVLLALLRPQRSQDDGGTCASRGAAHVGGRSRAEIACHSPARTPIAVASFLSSPTFSIFLGSCSVVG